MAKKDDRRPLLEDAGAGEVLATVSGRVLPQVHTVFGLAIFFTALVLGCLFHYHKIVQNQYFGYPDEFFPSVSATTGDRYPARAVFQIMCAILSGPRFLMHFSGYLQAVRVTNRPRLSLALLLIAVGRTCACAGFVYITSSDDHDLHDLSMLLYILLTFPYYVISILVARSGDGEVTWRRRFSLLFTFTLLPLAYLFVQHKVHRVPGAYSYYAMLEWALIIYDIAFDGCALVDLNDLEIRLVDVRGMDVPAWSLPVLRLSDPTPRLRGGSPPLLSPSSSFGAGLVFASDIYQGYVMWTLLTGLPVLIWYFPLWHMGISGYEAALFTNLLTALLGIGVIRRIPALPLQIIASLSLLAYALPTPEGRLGATAAGLVASLMSWLGKLRRDGASATTPLLLGLLLSLVLKAQWKGNNPAWPIMYSGNGGLNIPLTLFGLLSAVLLSYASTETGEAGIPVKRVREKHGSWAGAAIGLGSLLFALHSLFSDASIILRWASQPYPHTGPQPLPWAAGTIITASLGLGASLRYPHLRDLAVSLPGTLVALVAAMGIYYGPGAIGVASGWLFGAWVFGGGARVLLRNGTAHGPGRTLFVALLWYNVLVLAHVWVVAYAFVPGGDILRERMDIVQGAMCLGIAIGLGTSGAWEGGEGGAAGKAPASPTTRGRRREETPALSGPGQSRRGTMASIFMAAAAVAVYAGRAIAVGDVLAGTVQPHLPAETRAFTVAIWTIHFALDNDMWASEGRMARAIDELGIDVIGLLESDLQRIIMGHRDLTQALAEDLGMYSDYGPGPTGHTWGCTMLSRFPILRSEHLLLPSPVGELACAIHATLLIHGEEVDVLISHNGQEEDLGDRRLQTAMLADHLRSTPRPVVFAGYVVTKPHEEIYTSLMTGGNVEDIDPTDWDRWCEYMAFRGVKRIAYARVSHGGITDTEIQMGRFLLREGEGAASLKDQGRLVPETSIQPPVLRFPPQFYGAGVRGHRYHVHDAPKYYD